MSAFILSEYQFRVIASWFTSGDNKHHNYRFWGRDPEFLREQTKEYDAQGVLETLFALNAKAFKVRYGEECVCEYTFKRVESLQLMEVLKTLMCFQYQCSEGEVINSPEYTQLKEYINDLTCTMVMNSPEWRDSKGW
jgi:hypothetical protein